MRDKRLVFFDFPKERMKIEKIYENKDLLEKINSESPDACSLPEVDKYYATPVKFPAALAERPYIFSSIVLSADGKMAFFDNKAGPLVAKNNFLDPDGAFSDFWVLNLLRAYSDGVVFGGNTMKNEPTVSSHCYDQDLNEQRGRLLGKANHPVGIAVSLDGTDIPFDHFLMSIVEEDAYKVMIATSPNGLDYIQKNSPLHHVVYGPFASPEDVDRWQPPETYCDYDVVPVIVTGSGSVPDTAVFLKVLRRLGMERICIESPTYTSLLMKLGCMDEYFINYSMVYAGGVMTPAYNVPSGYLDHAHANLVSVGIHHSSFLFTRQRLDYSARCERSMDGYQY